MKLYFAPIQGHTDAAYRRFHAAHYGHTLSFPHSSGMEVIYTTPFIRLEKGEIRKKDLKDIKSELNEDINIVPQVIFKNEEELASLVRILKSEGAKRIDINMGCPFPLQTSRGRGAAAIANPECGDAVVKVVNENPDIIFSVKLRLGYEKEEYSDFLTKLNTLELDHVSVHPRIAKDQYSGELHIEAFEDIYNRSRNPVVYNGDITTPEEAKTIVDRYPELQGLMIGRGALGRPSIFSEIISAEEWDIEHRKAEMLKFHRELWNHYKENLIGGDHQVLSKILPFWEYSESEIGRKAWKAIKKSSNLSKYQTALTLI